MEQPVGSSLATNGLTPSVNGAVKHGARTTRKRSKVPRLKKWTLVLVEWLDAVKEQGDRHSDDDFTCAVRRSAGHFLKRSQEAITIAMEDDRGIDEASDCDNVTTIPLGMVRKVTVLVLKQD